MAAFTTHLRTICEGLAGYSESPGYGGIDDVLDKAIPLIFDFDFPVHDAEYRNVLCRKIVSHYYMREIGAETYAQWKFWLRTRLNEIMPYYNQLYNSTLLEFNPLYDVDVTTTRSGKVDGSTDVTDNSTGNDSKIVAKTGSGESKRNTTDNSSTTNENTNVNMFSDTPQGALDELLFGGHLTEARRITDSGNGSVNSTGTDSGNYSNTENVNDTTNRTTNRTGKTVANTTEEYLEKVQGKQGGGSSARMLIEYRKTFLNIDTMVIEELADLFFNLW